MSTQSQTVKQISDLIIAQLETVLNQTIPLLPKAFNRVLAQAIAAVWVVLYKFGGFVFLQGFPSKASSKAVVINGRETIPLIEWGELIGVGSPGLATNAELLIDVPVETQAGFLASGEQLLNSDNGFTYIVTADVPLDAAVIQANIKAVNDQVGGQGGGVLGNLAPGSVVSFVSNPPNVAKDAVVNSQTVTGANGEDVDVVYRGRVESLFKQRPQGGAYADYKQWGEEVEGIVLVLPYTGAPGEVDVYSEATAASSGNADGIPTPAQLQAVLDSIEKDQDGIPSRRNVNAFVNSLPITRTGFDVTVFGLVVDNTASVQAEIDSAVEEFFFNREPFIDGLSLLPIKNQITKTKVISIVGDIVDLRNGIFNDADFFLTGSPIALSTYILGEGEKAKNVTVDYAP